MLTTGYADKTQLLTLGDNRPGDKLTTFSAFTIHETANENPGATAELHYRYWSPGGGGRLISSVHFVVDSTESIQLMPIDEVAWHTGDVAGNATSCGIEICVNDRAGYPAACRKAAIITAKVLRAYNKTPQDGVTVRKHGSWSGTTHKLCPQHLNAGDWGVTWGEFVGMVNAAFVQTSTVDYVSAWGTAFPYFEASGIAREWRRAALVLGAATSDEHTDSSGVIWRHFAKGCVSYNPKTGACTSYFPRPA